MGTYDMRGFAHRMRAVAVGVPHNADKLMRQLTLAVTAVVVRGTPVDTGRAKANWQAQLGAPAEGVVQGYSPGSAGSTAGQAEALALARANEVATQYKGGVDVNITNNLPYIGRLNDGYSEQAPANFVQNAVAVAVRKVQSTRIIR
jgi:hypothetical protein